MPFQVIWTKKSKKDLKLFEKSVCERIIDKIELLGKEDFVFLEKIKNCPDYKFRVGKYRAIIKKFPATKKLFVLRVMHRKNVYNRIRK